MSLHTATDFISRPSVAVASSIGSVIVSLQPQLESGLRIATLLGGLLITLIALRKAWKNRNK